MLRLEKLLSILGHFFAPFLPSPQPFFYASQTNPYFPLLPVAAETFFSSTWVFSPSLPASSSAFSSLLLLALSETNMIG